MQAGRCALTSVLLLVSSDAAQAHSFGRLYTLPLPFWMYAAGAGAALLLSFVLVGWRMTQMPAVSARPPRDLSATPLGRLLLSARTLALARWLSLFTLLLCIATGLLGTRNAALNFNMTWFWIVFALGYAYLGAVLGHSWPALNPWHTLAKAIAAIWPRFQAGRWPYPAWMACWPALLLFMGFVWIELFGRSRPYPLALMLLAYTAITLTGVWSFGARAWFAQGEFFGRLFGLFAMLSPLAWSVDAQGRRRLFLRSPMTALLQARAQSMSEVLFLLFLLSSTAFDGLIATEAWLRWYWQDIAGLLQPWTGANIVQAYPLLKPLYLIFQSAALLISPLTYLVVYLACLAIARRLTASDLPMTELAQRFAYTLLPIALVYHFTHYWILLVTQGLMILRLASDPFGVGWNLFGTADWLPRPLIPDMDWVWHSQVWLIVAGHVLSVWLAHRQALALFGDRRRAALSQLPMLLWMVALTCSGLWILSQPLVSTRLPGS